MARTLFGGDPSSFTLDARGNVKAGVPVTVWSAGTGGTQYTDLLDVDGNAVTDGIVLSDEYGVLEFQGPDAVTTVYLDTGSARRLRLTSGGSGGGGGDVAAHEADSTDVHGIADTSLLATSAELAAHDADTTNVHGIADTTVLATDAELAAHAADTTSVHGITDTADLVTTAGLAAHTADTTSVHGIADTSALLTSADLSGYVAETAVNAKGDLLVATAADTVDALTVGANDYVLTADDAEDSGLKWAPTASDASKADISGVISQFSDVSTTAPADQNVLAYDEDTNLWTPTDLTGQFAGLGADARLAESANPQYYIGQLVLNEGDAIPDGTPTGTIILRRQLTASITPVYVGEDSSAGSTTCVVTTTQDIDVDDYVLIGWFASGETPVPTTFPSVTIGGGTGAIGTVESYTHQQATTVQSGILFAKCTTGIPTGATITVTVDDSRVGMGVTIAKADALLSASVKDQNGSGGNTGGTTPTAATGGATGQAQELGLFMVGFNPGPTDERTISGTNGWAAIGPTVAEHTTNDRAGCFFYRELSATGTITGTALIDNGGLTNSVWSATIVTLKAA